MSNIENNMKKLALLPAILLIIVVYIIFAIPALILLVLYRGFQKILDYLESYINLIQKQL